MNVCTFVEPPQPCIILYGKTPSLGYCAKCLDASEDDLRKFVEKKRKEAKKSDEYALLQRVRDRLITVKILLRETEQERDKALKIGLPEIAERENKLFRSFLSAVRDIEDQVKELEARCFGK